MRHGSSKRMSYWRNSGAVYVQNTLSLQRGCEKSEPTSGNPGQDLYAIDNILVTD